MMTATWLAVAGLGLLLLGGELLVSGAAALARRFGVSAGAVGMTVVAMGTSLPELVVSLDASLSGAPDIAVGNVVGSNIYNVLLVLGLAAMIRPCTVAPRMLTREWPIAAVGAVLLWVLSQDGVLGRGEGAVLGTGAIAFVVYTLRGGGDEAETPTPAPRHAPWAGVVARPALGTVLLIGGSRLLVTGAVDLATAAGITERVIGLTLVAVGTSLPELVTSAVAAARGQGEVAVGNVVGSNIFNTFGILGSAAVAMPLTVDPTLVATDIPWMVAVTFAVVLAAWPGDRIPRWKGALLLTGAAIYTARLAGVFGA